MELRSPGLQTKGGRGTQTGKKEDFRERGRNRQESPRKRQHEQSAREREERKTQWKEPIISQKKKKKTKKKRRGRRKRERGDAPKHYIDLCDRRNCSGEGGGER